MQLQIRFKPKALICVACMMYRYASYWVSYSSALLNIVFWSFNLGLLSDETWTL